MFCEECGKNAATVHITKIVNGKKTEVYLCEECSRKQENLQLGFEPSFSMHNFLAGLFDEGIFENAPASLPGSQEIKCDNCGLTYNQFKKFGRFGCDKCYRIFENRLEPLLRRIHGNSKHSGKIPKRAGKDVRVKREVQKLKFELQDAIRREAFEKAAELRDSIHALEEQLER